MRQGPGLPRERLDFAAVLAGHRPAWLTKPAPVDVWDGKGLVEGLVQRLVRRTPTLVLATGAERPAHLHPRGAARICLEDACIGSVGPLHPDVVDALDLGDPPW